MWGKNLINSLEFLGGENVTVVPIIAYLDSEYGLLFQIHTTNSYLLNATNTKTPFHKMVSELNKV